MNLERDRLLEEIRDYEYRVQEAHEEVAYAEQQLGYLEKRLAEFRAQLRALEELAP